MQNTLHRRVCDGNAEHRPGTAQRHEGLTRQMRSYSTLGGMEFVRAIWVERQKRSGLLQVYSGPALVRGASGSSGGQQLSLIHI